MEATGASQLDGWTPPKNMSHWSTNLTYDVIGDLTYGRRFNYVPRLSMAEMKFAYLASRLNGCCPRVKFQDHQAERERG
ncbi:hypothetical protein VTO42DRAFT_7027 [Malbranchea cinnamomea]